MTVVRSPVALSFPRRFLKHYLEVMGNGLSASCLLRAFVTHALGHFTARCRTTHEAPSMAVSRMQVWRPVALPCARPTCTYSRPLLWTPGREHPCENSLAWRFLSLETPSTPEMPESTGAGSLMWAWTSKLYDSMLRIPGSWFVGLGVARPLELLLSWQFGVFYG